MAVNQIWIELRHLISGGWEVHNHVKFTEKWGDMYGEAYILYIYNIYNIYIYVCMYVCVRVCKQYIVRLKNDKT